jgi:hypothetical protein
MHSFFNLKGERVEAASLNIKKSEVSPVLNQLSTVP